VDTAARKSRPAETWTIEDSLDLYGVSAWGSGYFGINAAGHIVVRPDQTAGQEIDLHEVIHGLEARDLTTPVVVRFSDILRHRLKRLHDAFASAISENDYRGHYTAV
jgi:arginine decarboxylase